MITSNILIFKKIFRELTENVRQKGDPVYAEMMSRIRIGSPTDDDVKLLLKRMISVLDNQSKSNCKFNS